MIPTLKRWPLLSLFFCILLYVTVFHPYRSGPPIRSDGVGYHIWTRALLSWDFNFCIFNTGFERSDLAELQGTISPPFPGTGICQNKYPPGLALLRLPFMAPFVKKSTLAGPLISKKEHQISLVLSMAALILVCFFSAQSLALFSVPSSVAELSILLCALGTGLFHYATFDGSFTHIYSALGVSILVWVLCRTASQPAQGRRDIGTILCSAFTILFLILVRNTNIFIALFYLAILFYLKRKQSFSFKTHAIWVGSCSAVGCALGIQLIYNFYATGQLSLNSYHGEGFILDHTMFRSIFLSYERGLFTYYPVLAVTLIAAFLHSETRQMVCLSLLLIIVYAALYGFWHSWMLGQGFGHRGFVELVPVFLILFGIATKDSKKKSSRLILILAVVCTWVTLQLMWGFWQGSFPYNGATPEVYWNHARGYQHPIFALVSGLGLIGALLYQAIRRNPA